MIAILGASGYVGQAFGCLFTADGIPHVGIRRRDVVYYDPCRLAEVLRERRAEFLINCAGYTGRPNVDACEDHKTECLAANAVLPGIVRQACEVLDISWGHISSGCIYTGSRSDGSGFRETDPPNFTFRQNNCSFYSGSKALGEELLEDADRCYVWRLRLPFNHLDGPRNYLSKLLRYETLVDVRNSLSDLDEVVRACYRCWTERLEYGTYNLTNGGSVMTREVVEMIKRRGLTNKTFRFFDSEEEFLRLAARTPRSNCVLDNSKALAAGLQLSPVHEALDRSLAQWVPERSPPP